MTFRIEPVEGILIYYVLIDDNGYPLAQGSRELCEGMMKERSLREMELHPTTLVNKITTDLLIRSVKTQLIDKFPKLKFVISGGCLRDTALSKPINDIDIVISMKDWFIIRREALWLMAWEHGPDNNYDHPQIQGQFTISLPFIHKPVNFIIWREDKEVSLAAVAEYNDFGICQISYDGDTVYATKQFLEDARTETFTLTRGAWGIEQSVKRYHNFAAGKYAGWKLDKSLFEEPLEATT